MASGSPQRRRSSVNVGFQENADNFVKNAINYENWDHSIANSDVETLKKFLMKQAEGEFDDLKLRLQTLQGESQDIQGHLSDFQKAAATLREECESYMVKKAEEVEARTQTLGSREQLSQQLDKQKSDFTSAGEKKRDLVNDRNKEIKAVTEKEFAALFAGVGKDDHIAQFLLKAFAQLLHNDSANTDWNDLRSAGKSFSSLAQFQLDMRAVEGTNLTQESLEDIRLAITGDGTMKKAKGDDYSDPKLAGRIFLLITDEDEKALAGNLRYFPFFRIISKAYHLIATSRKMARHAEKLKKCQQEQNTVATKVTAHDETIAALNVFCLLEDEAKNIEENEVAFFHNKLADIRGQVEAIEATLSGTNFADEFFA